LLPDGGAKESRLRRATSLNQLSIRMTMNRRDFLRAALGVAIVGGFAPEVLAQVPRIPPASKPGHYDYFIRDYLYKIRNFDAHHQEDVCLDQAQFRLLKSCVARFKRLQRTVGHGNFYLLSFDDAIKISRNYRRVGRFTKEEIIFLEMIFYSDAAHYGFLGKKPLQNLTARIQRRKVVKVPYTGNYLYKGLPLETYKKVRRDLGREVILTSGIRSVIKQFLLFLNKAYKNDGNLSLASRSLAPPGYSYHGIGDFDVGQVGLGADNFTQRFTTTRVYRKLQDLGYIKIRYVQDNMLGVRFEPWHIKVNSKA
jgi:D-alanyl-D-alanine carboxypeptidase